MVDTTLIFDFLAKDRASKTIKGVGSTADQTSKKFGGLGNVAKKAGATVGLGLAGIGAAAIAVGKKSFDAFKDFDSTMRKTGAITGESGKALEGLSNLALKMGKDTSFSAGEAADAMLELAKGGMTSAQIKGGALKETLTLAAAGGLGLGDAATYMSNELNAFGLKAKDAGSVAAALAGGANASTASVESLGQALSQVGPGATNAGLSLNDTVGVLAAFDQAGIKGSDAGTSLKTMLTRLIPTTNAAQGAFETLGLKFTNADGSFKSITKIAQELQDKLGGMTAAQKTATLQAIFGSDATRAATVLMKEGSKGIGKYIKATKDKSAAEKLAKTNTSGAAGAVEQLHGSIETLEIIMGKALAPVILKVVKGLTGLFNWAIKLAPKIGKVLGPAFKTARDYLSAFLNGLKGGSAGGTGALVTLTQAGGKLRDALGKMKKVAGDLFAQLKSGFEKLNKAGVFAALGQAIEDTVKVIGRILGFFAKHIHLAEGLAVAIGAVVLVTKAHTAAMKVQKAGGFVKFITAWAKQTKIGSAATKAWTAIQWLFNAAMDANPIALVAIGVAALVVAIIIAYKKSDTFRKIVTAAFDGVKKVVASVVGWFKKSFVPFFTKTIPGAFQAVLKWVKHNWPILLALLIGPFGVTVILIIKNWDKIKKIFGKALDAIKHAVSKAWNAVKDTISDVFKKVTGKVVDWAKKAPRLLYKAGKDLLGGLKDGVLNVARTISNWERDHIVNPVVNVFKRSASWLVSEGKHLIGGLKNGILGAIRGIGQWERAHIVNPVVGVFKNSVKWLTTEGGHLIRGLKDGIGNAMRGIKSWLSDHVWGPIKNGVKSLFGINSPSKKFHEFGLQMIRGLVNGLIAGNAGKFVHKVFGGVSSGAIKALKFMVSHGEIALSKLGDLSADVFAKIFPSNGAGTSGSNLQIGQQMAAARGWTGSQWQALKNLWTNESGWRTTANNPSSGAYGIPQALPRSKMASAGSDYLMNPATQIRWGLGYIADRYGTPLNAWMSWLSRNPHWYGSGLQGGIFNRPTLIGVGERGPERVDVTPLSRPRKTGGGGVTVNMYISGPVGSQRELETWLVRSLDNLGRKGRVPRSLAVTRR